ncbi:uncharacterized protein UTRI_00703_B [Ustilago trichophora]|uniref:G-patch domain-containing protein n=1 Tax=Ustilago trichophora TaxID=86804 RepID=A0A5C3DPS2_9BASI|nr:uncharacterized protein UTRI_00703_B [Ustilago trichophora]
MTPSSSSSRPTRFDPVQLLSEIQGDQPTASSSTRPHEDVAPTSDDDEDDFMSDKYLPKTDVKQPLTYTDKRRKLEAHHSRKSEPRSLKQREEEAREEGLDRDLLAEAEIVAGGGRLPPQGRDGRSRWDLMDTSEAVGEAFKNGDGAAGGGEDGTTKAMRMMLAMGYRRGQALGKRTQDSTVDNQEEVEEEEEEEDFGSEHPIKVPVGAETTFTSPPSDDDPASLDSDEEASAEKERDASQGREEDEYLTGGVSLAPFTTTLPELPDSRPSNNTSTDPLRPDQRWLGPNRRAGIGMIPKTSPAISAAILAKASSSYGTSSAADRSQAEQDYRTRISLAHRERHDLNLLSWARKTLIELDRSTASHYSPLWLDSSLYHILSGHTPASNMDDTTIDERMQKDPAFKEAVDLLQLAFSSQDPDQVKEAKTFCELDTKSQLELVLSSLRRVHAYCLFCGCQYDDQKSLLRGCPGETEDDHD